MSRITLLLLISTLFSKFQYEFQSFNLEMETKKISFQFVFFYYSCGHNSLLYTASFCIGSTTVFPVGFARTPKILAVSGCLAGFQKVQLNV